MNVMSVAYLLIVFLWAGVLSWLDLTTRRLPNWLTIGGAVVALIARFGFGGWPLFLDGLAAGAVAAAFLLLPFLMRGAGGGDVKMLFATGAIVGWSRVLTLLLVSSFAGLILGIGMLIAGRLDGSRLKHYARCAWDWRYDRQAGAAALPPRESQAARVPFSLAITAGLIWALLL